MVFVPRKFSFRIISASASAFFDVENGDAKLLLGFSLRVKATATRPNFFNGEREKLRPDFWGYFLDFFTDFGFFFRIFFDFCK